MKAIICVGISSSGKSTFAQEWVSVDIAHRVEINRDYVRFNIVSPDSDWGTYKMTKANEQLVSEQCEKMIHRAKIFKSDVIISDTNLNAKYRNQLLDKLQSLGYDVEIKEFPISLEEAWKRDSLRASGVGHPVIYKQYLKWLEYKGEQKYIPNPNLPKTVLVDIDGTVAERGDRGWYEWESVGKDNPRSVIIDVVRGMKYQGYKIVFVSGRDAVCREQTKSWLDKHVGTWYDALYMREKGDMRKDSIVKREIFFRDIAPKYNVQCVVDDRPQVLREWRYLGIPNILSVGDPWIEF